MPKNVHFPANSVHVGQQFVFFSSLEKDDPLLASKASQVLNSGLSDIDINDSANNKMQAVINFFDAVIAREQKNEKEYMRRQAEKFKDMPLCKAKLFSNKVDYMDFIAMLNFIKQETEKFSFTVKNEKARLKKIQEELKKEYKGNSRAQKHQKIEETMKKSTAMSLLTEDFKEELDKTAAALDAKKIEEALKAIINSPSLTSEITKYVEANFAQLGKNGKITNRTIVQYLIQALYQNLDIENISSNIEEVFNRKLDAFYQKNIARFGLGRIEKNDITNAYEVINAEGLADTYLKRANKRVKNPKTLIDYIIFNKRAEIPTYKMIDDIANAINKMRKKQNESITIGRTTYSYRDGEYTVTKGKKSEVITYGDMIKRLKRRLSVELKGAANTFITQEQLESIFIKQLYIDVPSLSEVRAGAQSAVEQGLQGNVRVSGYLSLKNDVEFFVSYNPNAFITEFQKVKTRLLNNFSNLVAEEESLARKELSRKATTNTRVSADAFFSAVAKTLSEAEEELYLLEADADDIVIELGQLLNNGFYIQESVKDIQFIDPDIGFRGGTLGADWQIALSNLFQMYETGGLSVDNYEWMKFAILNCSSASLGKDLRNPVEKYLSFAAAMMMFNYGEAELQRVAEELRDDFTHAYSPEFINLYVLNGIYFPSSYILTLVREGLYECQEELKRKSIKKRYSSSGVKIINKATPSWIDPEADPYDAEWFKIGAQANDQIQIIFTFLAGFLDILDDLERKMNNLL